MLAVVGSDDRHRVLEVASLPESVKKTAEFQVQPQNTPIVGVPLGAKLVRGIGREDADRGPPGGRGGELPGGLPARDERVVGVEIIQEREKRSALGPCF